MLETQPGLPLPAVKLALGQPDFLDYRALDLVDAHRRLGEQVRAQVHHILRRKIGELTPEALALQVRLARYCGGAIRRKLEQSGEEARRAALEEYVTCLAAWGQGAELAAFDVDGLREVRVDGLPVSDADLAYMLQDDDVGCQTGLWRAADGTVFLLHTEEDREPPGARFDRLRLLAFTVSDHGRPTQIFAFMYPDLLPGSAFGWRSDNYVQAVDSLNLRPQAPESGILANIATWVTLRLGKSADLDETIRYLGPFADGYALNAAYADDGEAFGQKVEFAGTYSHGYRLGDAPGSFLYQVNKFADPNASVARRYEAVALEKRLRLEERLSRAESWLRALRPDEADVPAALFRFLCSREGGDYACANRDVKAYLIAQSAVNQFQVSMGAGPALAGDEPEFFRFPV
jgi:hypothetical protein